MDSPFQVQLLVISHFYYKQLLTNRKVMLFMLSSSQAVLRDENNKIRGMGALQFTQSQALKIELVVGLYQFIYCLFQV